MEVLESIEEALGFEETRPQDDDYEQFAALVRLAAASDVELATALLGMRYGGLTVRGDGRTLRIDVRYLPGGYATELEWISDRERYLRPRAKLLADLLRRVASEGVGDTSDD